MNFSKRDVGFVLINRKKSIAVGVKASLTNRKYTFAKAIPSN